MKTSLALAALLALSACGGGGSSDNTAADQLRNAADASTPEAADVLENGADRLESQGGGNASDVQNVMQDAGNAQMLNQSGNGQSR
jgi:ABC-type glycerol-3-phosphate transport system substrate-binding protein